MILKGCVNRLNAISPWLAAAAGSVGLLNPIAFAFRMMKSNPILPMYLPTRRDRRFTLTRSTSARLYSLRKNPARADL